MGPKWQNEAEILVFLAVSAKNCVLHVHVVMGVARETGLCWVGVWLGCFLMGPVVRGVGDSCGRRWLGSRLTGPLVLTY